MEVAGPNPPSSLYVPNFGILNAATGSFTVDFVHIDTAYEITSELPCGPTKLFASYIYMDTGAPTYWPLGSVIPGFAKRIVVNFEGTALDRSWLVSRNIDDAVDIGIGLQTFYYNILYFIA